MISVPTIKASLADLRQSSSHCSPAESVQTTYKTALIALKAIVPIPPLPVKRTKRKDWGGREGWKQGSAYRQRVSLTINNKKAAMQTAWNLVQLTKSQLHLRPLYYSIPVIAPQFPFSEKFIHLYEDHTAHVSCNTVLLMLIAVRKFKRISSS